MLDSRNGDGTSGQTEDVAGSTPSACQGPPPPSDLYSRDERKQLLQLARETVREAAVSGQRPKVNASVFPAKLSEIKGCFVTLTEAGQLRGCIGNIFALEPLFQAVVDNAFSAVLQDYRFEPVQPEEVARLEIEISVLTTPQPLKFKSPEDLLTKLQPHRDGVVLNLSGHSATYLPQVWEQLLDKVRFLESLSQKAGSPASAWREAGASVMIYHVEAFQESAVR